LNGVRFWSVGFGQDASSKFEYDALRGGHWLQ
jgi:hypothetical protein